MTFETLNKENFIFQHVLLKYDFFWFNFDPKVKVRLFQRANDHFALVNGLLGKIDNSKLGIWMRENLRIQGDSLRNERENFGVQQLPLFKLLEPEELDWRILHSWPGGERWLNTRVPKNFHSKMDGEWAYRCHLEECW